MDRDFLPVYATRVARMIFLRHSCGEGHPTLQSEVTLVEMARSKLREQILSDRLPRPGLEDEVRSLIVEHLRGMVRSPEEFNKLSSSVPLLTIDEILRAAGSPSRELN